MKRIGFFSTFARSFYDLSVYRDAADAEGGGIFWYFCRMLVIAIVLMSFGCNAQVGRGLDEASKAIGEADIPEVVVKSGQATVNVKQPWIQKTDDGSVFIIDTTGKTTAIPAEARGGLLLTKDKLFVHQATGMQRVQVYPLSQFPDVTINKATLQSWMGTIKSWSLPVILIGNGIYQFCAKLIQSIFVCIVAIVVFSSRQVRRGFAAGWNIALVAMTPPLIVMSLIGLFGIRLPLAVLLYYVAYLVYVVLGAMRCENPLPPAPVTVNVPPPPIVPPTT